MHGTYHEGDAWHITFQNDGVCDCFNVPSYGSSVLQPCSEITVQLPLPPAPPPLPHLPHPSCTPLPPAQPQLIWPDVAAEVQLLKQPA